MSFEHSLHSVLAPSLFARRTMRFGLGAILSLGLAVAAAAQGSTLQAAPVENQASVNKAVVVTLTQAKVVRDAQGKEALVESSAVKPGDVLEYTATYTNHTGKTVSGLIADLPIPEGVAYMPRTAKPGAAVVKAATQDGKFAAEPLLREVDERDVLVPYSEYRALRWFLGKLPAKGVTTVSARVKVESVVPAVPATAPAKPRTTAP